LVLSKLSAFEGISRTLWQLFRKLLAENAYIYERLLDRRLKLLGPPAL